MPSPLVLCSAFCVLLVSFFAWDASAGPASAWRDGHTVDGMKVEIREVANSDFEEIRVTTQSDLKLEALCDAVWGKDASDGTKGDFKKRVVIRETDSDRWTYEQIRVPIFADRDYVLHVRRRRPTASNCHVQFETCSDPTWPESADHVRIPEIRGSWDLKQGSDGKVTITYVVYSDPGGDIPALFTRGAQRSSAIQLMKTILARAHPVASR